MRAHQIPAPARPRLAVARLPAGSHVPATWPRE